MVDVEVHQAAPATRGTRTWPWWKPALVFLGIGAAVWLTAYVAGAVLPRDYLYPRLDGVRGGALVERWVRWDSSWYREIVRHGYVYYPDVQSSVAFFPAYPLALAALGWLVPDIFARGIAVTVVSGLCVAVLFYRWSAERLAPASAATALLVLLVYPYAYYLYGAVYSDAFFLASAMAAFMLVERRRYWLAGIAGFVASAGRPTGVAVAIALVLLVLERANSSRLEICSARTTGAGDISEGPTGRVRILATEMRARFDPRGFPLRATPVLLAFGGLLAWMGYLWERFGDPLLFVHIEGMWKQGAGPSTWLKFAFFREMRNVGISVFSSGLILHAVVGIGALLLVPRVARRFGWSYACYVALVVGIPVIGTKDFMSTGRYALAAFPCFALVGALLAERSVPTLRRAWLASSAVLLLVFTSLWTMGKYLA